MALGRHCPAVVEVVAAAAQGTALDSAAVEIDPDSAAGRSLRVDSSDCCDTAAYNHHRGLGHRRRVFDP